MLATEICCMILYDTCVSRQKEFAVLPRLNDVLHWTLPSSNY